MTRVLGLLLLLLTATPAIARDADTSAKTKATSATRPRTMDVPSATQTVKPQVVTPPIRKRDPALKTPGDARKLEVPGSEPGGQRVPLEGSLPLEPARVPRRPSSLPQAIPGAEGVRKSLQNLLRVDGRTGSADLRGRDPAVARVEWNLDSPESDLAVITIRRAAGTGCPAAGTSLDRLADQLRSDSSVVAWEGWVFARGSNRTQFAGLPYQGLREVFVQACGIDGNALNGVASNVVRVRTGSPHQVLRLPATRWSVEWSTDTSRNAACLGSLDVSVPPAPRGAQIGFQSRVARGSGPIPCVRDTLTVAQPSAAFDVSALPRDARILRAELRFTETDPERASASGRLCSGVTRSVGRATNPVRSGNHSVSEVSGRADDERPAAALSGWRRRVDVTDWVTAWQGGRAADVTFLGPTPRRDGAACQAQLGDVHIFVEYE